MSENAEIHLESCIICKKLIEINELNENTLTFFISNNKKINLLFNNLQIPKLEVSSKFYNCKNCQILLESALNDCKEIKRLENKMDDFKLRINSSKLSSEHNNQSNSEKDDVQILLESALNDWKEIKRLENKLNDFKSRIISAQLTTKQRNSQGDDSQFGVENEVSELENRESDELNHDETTINRIHLEEIDIKIEADDENEDNVDHIDNNFAEEENLTIKSVRSENLGLFQNRKINIIEENEQTKQLNAKKLSNPIEIEGYYHQNTRSNFDLRTGSFINNNLSSLSNTMEMEVNRPLNLSDDCYPGRIQPNRLARRSLDQLDDSLGSLPLPDFDLNDENVIMNAFTDFWNATDNNKINMTQEALEFDVSLEETSQLGIHEVPDERNMLLAITPADDSIKFPLPNYLFPPPPPSEPSLLHQPTPTPSTSAASMQQNNPKKARKQLPNKNANSKKKEKEKKGEKRKGKKKEDHDFEIDNVKKYKARLSVSRTCEENESNPVRTIGETNPIDHPEKFVKNLAFVIDNVAFGNENGAGAELNGVDIKEGPLNSDNNSQQSSSSKNLLPVSTSTHSQQSISNQQLQDIIANNVNDLESANRPNANGAKTQIEIRVSVKQRRKSVIDKSINNTNNNAIENAVHPTYATTPKAKRKYVRKTRRL